MWPVLSVGVLCRPKALGLRAFKVVPKGLHPKAALRRRTLWMVKRSALVVLFPENPYDRDWGPGSRLVFRSYFVLLPRSVSTTIGLCKPMPPVSTMEEPLLSG